MNTTLQELLNGEVCQSQTLTVVYPESFGCVHNGVEQSLPHPWHYTALNVCLRDMCHSKFVKTTFFIGLFFVFFYTVKYA